MKLLRTLMTALIALAISAAAPAQNYSISNPTYIPTAVLAATTFTTAGTATFNNNGNGTILIRVAGTNTGLSGVVQISESRATSPSWTTVPVQTIGGGVTSTIIANGLYRLNVSGAAQIRFNLASVTGTNVIVSAAATPGAEFVSTLPVVRSTYTAAVTVTPASSATDFLTVAGSASKTVRIQRAQCSGTAASTATGTLVALKRSAANTGGTSSSATAVSYDSGYANASASVLTFTTNPTTGALVGNLRSSAIVVTATTSSAGVQPVTFDFGGEQSGVVLRGAAQVFALNGAAASFPASTSLLCNVIWTEE